MMLHTELQNSRPYGFRQDVFIFSQYNLNKLVRGILGDVTYLVVLFCLVLNDASTLVGH